MFIPMASPVVQLNLIYRFFPAIATFMSCNLANLLDLHTCVCVCTNDLLNFYFYLEKIESKKKVYITELHAN